MDGKIKKTSLWRETWKTVWQISSDLALPYLGFVVMIGIFYYAASMLSPSEITQQIQKNPQFLHQHPEMNSAYIHELLKQGAAQLFIWIIFGPAGYYVFTTICLRRSMTANRPDYSWRNFFYWFGKAFRKNLRCLWLLLPIIGFYFYLRAVIRYIAVSPLAITRHGDELKTSWNLTQDKWWRIFGNSCALALSMMLLVLIVGLMIGIPLGVASVALHFDRQSPIMLLSTNLMQGMGGAATIVISSVYNCTIWRVLSQEQQTAQIPGITKA